MNRISKIFLIITVALQICWLLPWCYSFLNTRTYNTPFVMYSSVLGDFICMEWNEETGATRVDTKGNSYTLNETDSLLPFFYVRQLMAEQRFPETICGKKFTPHQIQMSNFSFRANAYDLNAPKIGLYPLLESLPKRLDLEMSDDVFRITSKGIEFITMETNKPNEDKSKLFTKVMTDKGFSFPATYIEGKPNPRKDYDEGFLLLDSEGKLFHMKQICGRPYVKAIQLPEGLKLKHLFITEFPGRKTLGFMTDEENRFYVLETDSYKIHRTGVPSFNPEKENCIIIGNLMDWTICITNEECEHNYAIDAEDYHLIQTLSYPVKSSKFSLLSFTSYNDKYVRARFF